MDKFVIQPGQNIKQELKKILFSQVMLVHEMTCDRSEGINKNVHEIRKRLKMIRSVIRIMRDSAGYSFYYRENIRFRDLARKLAPSRDREVLLQNAMLLAENMPNLNNEKQFQFMLTDLARHRDEALHKILITEDVCSHIRTVLETVLPEINKIELRNSGFEVIEKGIRRMYCQARKYLAIIKENEHDPVVVHILRKRVKYLWHQIQLLDPIYPGHMQALGESLHKISDDLGAYRDSYLFRSFLKERKFYGLSKAWSTKIIKYLTLEMDRRLDSAIEEASKFYHDKPEEFTSRINSWYDMSKQA